MSTQGSGSRLGGLPSTTLGSLSSSQDARRGLVDMVRPPRSLATWRDCGSHRSSSGALNPFPGFDRAG
jgi:hypothetical protein